jgi:hypothetical protein
MSKREPGENLVSMEGGGGGSAGGGAAGGIVGVGIVPLVGPEHSISWRSAQRMSYAGVARGAKWTVGDDVLCMIEIRI